MSLQHKAKPYRRSVCLRGCIQHADRRKDSLTRRGEILQTLEASFGDERSLHQKAGREAMPSICKKSAEAIVSAEVDVRDEGPKF